MTIKETVKQALIAVRGNREFSIFHLAVNPEIAEFEPSQIKRALRDLPHVKRVNGHYIVKGRRVPPLEVDITRSENSSEIPA